MVYYCNIIGAKIDIVLNQIPYLSLISFLTGFVTGLVTDLIIFFIVNNQKISIKSE